MAMTPEEYAARELRVPGWETAEPENEHDPNILTVLNGGPVRPEKDPDAETIAMVFEYNFTLPLELRRAELVTEAKKQDHLDARTQFWNVLSLSVATIVNLVK